MIDVRRRLQSAEEPFGRDIEPDRWMRDTSSFIEPGMDQLGEPHGQLLKVQNGFMKVYVRLDEK